MHLRSERKTNIFNTFYLKTFFNEKPFPSPCLHVPRVIDRPLEEDDCQSMLGPDVRDGVVALFGKKGRKNVLNFFDLNLS